MLQKILAIITVVSIFLLVVTVTTTTPATAGPLGLLLLFVSAYLTSLGLISFFLYGVSRVYVFVVSGMATRRPPRALTFQRAYYFSTILAAAPVLLIGLQSVGAVSLYEVSLVIIFVAIGCLYISKRIF
jgi:hypothetical protein